MPLASTAPESWSAILSVFHSVGAAFAASWTETAERDHRGQKRILNDVSREKTARGKTLEQNFYPEYLQCVGAQFFLHHSTFFVSLFFIEKYVKVLRAFPSSNQKCASSRNGVIGSCYVARKKHVCDVIVYSRSSNLWRHTKS